MEMELLKGPISSQCPIGVLDKERRSSLGLALLSTMVEIATDRMTTIFEKSLRMMN